MCSSDLFPSHDSAWLLSRKLAKFDYLIDKDLISKIIREAFPVGALLVVFTVYNRVDTVILGYYKGQRQ